MDMNRCIEKSSAKSSDSPNMASRGPGGFYGGPGGGEPLPDDIFIRVRGLPWSCNVNEIEKFFQGIFGLLLDVLYLSRAGAR